MRRKWPIRGLYAITPEEPDTRRLLKLAQAVLDQGVALMQYRNKGSDAALRLEQALALKLTCLSHGVPLIVNDDVALARTMQADGVHLGEDDSDPSAARDELGNDALVGVSCYASIERAKAAKSRGADYLAFGAFFSSSTKPYADPSEITTPATTRRSGFSTPADLSVLREATRLGLPLVAIGGIGPDNVATLRDAGADLIAVISGLWSARDPGEAARAYIAAFGDPT